MPPALDDNAKRYYWIVALVAAIPRFLFIFFASESVGDGVVYETVAENILSGCGVSISPIGSGECVPHFGGNQGPGYPAFIALSWWISGHSDLAVPLAQGLVYVAAILYLVNAIWRYTSSPKLALWTGLILAISPLAVAWPRYIFTETLAMSGALFLFAELIKSLYESKLRVIPITIILVIATFIRLDGILLLVPVAVAGFIIHRPADALRKGLVIALIFGLSWGGWLWRNSNVGLTNIFSPLSVEYYDANKGFYSWGLTWSTSHYEKSAWEWPLVTRDYDSIRVSEQAFITTIEKQKVRALLEELKQYRGKPFPKHIDDQFTELARKHMRAEPLAYYLLNPIKRNWALWSNIYDSSAWPIGLGGMLSFQDRVDIANGGIRSKFLLLQKYPVQTMGKVFVNGWKLLLYLLFLATIIKVYRGKEPLHKNIMTLALSFVLARIILTGSLAHVAARYALMQIPIIEMMVVLVIGHAILNRKKILQG